MERRTLQGIRARADPPFRSRSGPNQGATVSMPVLYPLQLELHADLHITRWRPLVQWLLAIPHLMIAYALRFLRQALTLISFFTVLFTEQIPRPLFDAIVMTYRYEWRAMSYAFFMHEDYPPFDFDLSLRRRRRRTPHLAAPDLSRAPAAVAAAVQVVPGHTPVLRAGRPGHRGGPGPHRRLVRRAVHRGVPRGHPGLPGQRLPLHATGRGLRRFPHRPLPALQPRRVRQRPARRRWRWTLTAADVDDTVIDQGLLLIRTLWDAGIAHRDIKPGNLMVRSGELLLIDVAFVQVRPSPWRQAVDLGNMMLVLAVRTDPQRVYRRAVAYFTEAELAEAFAATRGVASPTQLRAFMKRHPRDLLGEFRALAPQRPPIALQRWSIRRIALAAAMLAIITAAVWETGNAFLPAAKNLGAYAPSCGTGHSMILSAQAVPSAALLPCIAALPAGWSVGGVDISSGKVRLRLDSDRAGPAAITVTLTATCDTSGAQPIPSDQPGMRRFERPPSLVAAYSGVRYYTFPGGCATYRFVLAPGASPALATTVDTAVAFMPRSELVGYVRRTEGLALCGRGAACPG